MCSRFLVLLCLFLYSLSPAGVSALDVNYGILGQDFLYTCLFSAPVTWTVHGNVLTSNSSEHTIYPNGSILITPLTNVITGLGVTNRCCRGDDDCSAFAIILSTINPPKVDNITALEHTDVTLTCEAVFTLPAPTFSWYRGGDMLSSNRELQLTNVSRSDSGTYTCTVLNPLGTNSSDLYLGVEYEPSIAAVGTDIRHYSVGDTVELQCNYTGEPNPVIKWYFSEEDVLSGASEIVSADVVFNSAESVTFTIASVSYNQTGYYFCVAENTRGISHASFQVIVLTMPQPPSVSVIATTSSSISIRWVYRGNGNSPLTHTFLEYRANNSVWENNLISGNFTTGFTFTQLSANTNYTIKVSVLNAIGTSMSESVSASTQPMPPPEPRSVQLRVISQEALELQWKSPILTHEHAPITQYQHQLRSVDGGIWSSLISSSQSQFRVEYPGLTAGTLYEARVRALNSVGPSSYVTISNRTTFTYPGQPVLSTVSLDFQTIRVSWSATTTGGKPLLYWSLEISADSMDWTMIGTFVASRAQYDITQGLEPNSTYFIRIWVYNEIGSSPYSVVMVRTRVKGAIEAVSMITEEFITHNSISIAWQPIEYEDISVALEYEIKYSLLVDSIEPTHVLITDQTSYTFQDLEPLSTYKFSLTARDGNDVSVSPLVFFYTTTLPPLHIVLIPPTPIPGDKFKLSCMFSDKFMGLYTPSYVYWYKEEVDLREVSQNADPPPEDFYLYKNHLVIPSFDSSHYGNYSCRVRDMLAYEYLAKLSTNDMDFWKDNLEIIIIAAAILACFLSFLCLLFFVLCCIGCCRKRQKARNARYPVGIPNKSWLNPSVYSPLREASGLNPLKPAVETHLGPRDSSLEPDQLFEPESAGPFQKEERVYTTSFMHTGNTPSGTFERQPIGRPPVVAHFDRFEGASSPSSKVDSDIQGPPPPPPFSTEEVFGDSVSLPKRLTITEGLNSFRYEREGFGSPPSSVVTAPNFDNISNDSNSQPIFQHSQPLYQNLHMENGSQHVQGVEIIHIPSNCISTDI